MPTLRQKSCIGLLFLHYFLGEGEGEKACVLAGALSLGRRGGKEGKRGGGKERDLAVRPTGQTAPSPVRAKCSSTLK